MKASVVRVRRSVAENRRIVELTVRAGASVAQAEGVNSHQLFQWRRAYRRGELVAAGERASSLLPVVMTADSRSRVERQQGVSQELALPLGAIHIELPGRGAIHVERGAD